MSDKKQMRKQVYVDSAIQGALIGRVVFYWLVCLISIILMLLCWNVLSGPPRPFSVHIGEIWYQYGPALVASTLLLPLVIMDILRFSNRFVGPLFRLRRSMRKLAQGEPVEPIEFRGDDFWHDVADEFNAVARQVQDHSSNEYYSPLIEEQEEPMPVG